MMHSEPLNAPAVAVSISESPDLAELGLGPNHLVDAMAEVARHLLAIGATIIYGGDLRTSGFSELLFELVLRYRRDANLIDAGPSVTNYLAWPVHISLTSDEILKQETELREMASLVCLRLNGSPMEAEERQGLRPIEPTSRDWAAGLTSMRKTITRLSDARIVLGGRVDGFRGTMPGIAEETLASLQAQRPIFVLGGFGGCARVVAEMLGLMPTSERVGLGRLLGFEVLTQYRGYKLNNGLSFDENLTLARTVHVDEMVVLILKGLFRQERDPHPSSDSLSM